MIQVCPLSCGKRAALLRLSLLGSPARRACSSKKQPSSNLAAAQWEFPIVKVPTGYNGAPHVCSQNYPFPLIDPQTPLPASSMDSSDPRCQTASGSDQPFFHNALDRQTNRLLMGKFDDYRPLSLYRQHRGLIIHC